LQVIYNPNLTFTLDSKKIGKIGMQFRSQNSKVNEINICEIAGDRFPIVVPNTHTASRLFTLKALKFIVNLGFEITVK